MAKGVLRCSVVTVLSWLFICCSKSVVVHADIVELTDSNFDIKTQASASSSSSPISSSSSSSSSWFVLFKGNACPHCERIKPIFEELAQEQDLLDQDIQFGRVDVPTNVLTSSRFSIRSFPTMFYLHKNRFYQYKGKRTVESMKEYLLQLDKSNEESFAIPEPLSQLTLLYYSLMDIYELALIKGGPVGGLAVLSLFGTAILMLVLALVLSLYLLYILYGPNSYRRRAQQERKIN